MARRTTYKFERLERERAKAAKKAAREQAKRDVALARRKGEDSEDEVEARESD